MKISRSSGYGMLAIGYIAQNDDKSIILSQDIARKYNIPLEYLLKIMQQLVRANILQSKRGPRGGFSLARSLKKITMLEVIEAVDGPMVSRINLAEQSGGEKFSIRTEKVYEKALAQAKSVYEKVKLADLIK